jgi:hypothetical protein
MREAQVTDTLIELAKAYLNTAAKMASIRSEMTRLLANGMGHEPGAPANPIQPSAKTGGKNKPKATKAAKPRAEMTATARAAEEKVLDLVRSGMTRTAEIAKAVDAKVSTVSERLRRLRAKGLVQLSESGGWAASP